MRTWVLPPRWTAAMPEASNEHSDQSPLAAATDIVQTEVAVALACQSAFSSAVLPLSPAVCTSTTRLPWVVNGLVPDTEPRLIRSRATATVTASGTDRVPNDRMPRYSSSAAVSPARIAVVVADVLTFEPPTLEVSDDSST